jgi:hypothetical protein
MAGLIRDATDAVGLTSKAKVRKPLASSWLAFGEYDPNDQTLELTTLRGASFTHEGVPEEIAMGLFDAPSAGDYWHSVLKDNY